MNLSEYVGNDLVTMTFDAPPSRFLAIGRPNGIKTDTRSKNDDDLRSSDWTPVKNDGVGVDFRRLVSLKLLENGVLIVTFLESLPHWPQTPTNHS